MIFRYGNFVIGQLEYLYLLIPMAMLLIILLVKKYIKEEQRLVNNLWLKITIFFFRMLFFFLLVLALSGPKLEYRQTGENITKLKILIDDSYSMGMFDIGDTDQVFQEISGRGFTVELNHLNLEDYSSLGNSILNYLAPEENILLVSDGQNNFGSEMEDVALFANSIGSRIFGINLESDKEDALIYIDGPSKVVSGVDNTYEIIVNEIGDVGKKTVKIYIDDVLVHGELYDKKVEIKTSFQTGNHIIKATLGTEHDDLFEENNIYYKTVTVYSKPDILYVSKTASPLRSLYSPFYSIQSSSDLQNLDSYHAVVLNNIPADDLSEEDLEALEEYVSDGNGLFVIGGKESYDRGNYNTSLLLSMLPVNVGKAKKQNDVTNIVILMDTGTGARINNKSEVLYIDIQKAVAADIIKSISSTNRVGLIEANNFLYTLSGLSELGPKRVELIALIGRLTTQGISEFRYAYLKAHDMLRLVKGSKNIVLITDGDIQEYEKSILEDLVWNANKDGIKTFVINTGKVRDDLFLHNIKGLGGGEIFLVDETSRIKIYFGNPGEIPPEDLSLYVYDSNHFITQDIEELSSIYGFNEVYPKSTARLLLTTTAGDPVLTVWNYGLGRVASWASDDGFLWIPEMLNQENSKLLIRTLNWLVEDPERKNSFAIDIPELREGENCVVTVRSETQPVSEELNFYEVDNGLFKANYYPNSTGITELLNISAGVNYKKEYLYLGMNKDFDKILQISGGELLEPDAAQISERIKSISNVETVTTKDICWIFVVLAMAVYLSEILMRRIYELSLKY
ncbi:hypothetical protein JXC34_03460 [Candidatus Woesearchaeota archaeon]|nr:hypothetical protein [Candidatus Woesearchaeota archaeon]